MISCIVLILLMCFACTSLVEFGESAAGVCLSYAFFVVIIVIIRCFNPMFGGLL